MVGRGDDNRVDVRPCDQSAIVAEELGRPFGNLRGILEVVAASVADSYDLLVGNPLRVEGFVRLPRRVCAPRPASCSTRGRRSPSTPSGPPTSSACCLGSAASACTAPSRRPATQARPRCPAQHPRSCLRRGARLVPLHDQILPLGGYGGEIRQITLLRGAGRLPAFLPTNDFQSSLSAILRRYARRWHVEQSISKQLALFRLNRLSSSMAVKVDLAVTILANHLLGLPTAYRRLRGRPAASQRCPHPTRSRSVHRLAEEETRPARPAGNLPGCRHPTHPLAGQSPHRLPRCYNFLNPAARQSRSGGLESGVHGEDESQ